MGVKLRVGSRGSALALRQVELLSEALPDIEIEVVRIKTTGDKRQGLERKESWDKKDWVLEIEEALVKKEIDLALHSAKDVPVEIKEGSRLKTVLKRAEPRDLLISKGSLKSLKDCSRGSVIATASARRKAQILSQQPEASVIPLRGNVPTRIKKLEDNSELDAIVLAAAGVSRLGISFAEDQLISFPEMLPAVNQGILVVQFLSSRTDLEQIVGAISDKDTEDCFLAEREFVRAIGADCHSAVGVFANIEGAALRIQARVLSGEGDEVLEMSEAGERQRAKEIALDLAESFLKSGARKILEKA